MVIILDLGRVVITWKVFRLQSNNRRETKDVMAGEEFSRVFASLLASLRSQKQREDKVTKIDENILLG